MKIFAVVGQGTYCGGSIIVAAKKHEDAAMIAQGQSHKYSFNINYLDGEITLIGNDPKIKVPGILHIFELGE